MMNEEQRRDMIREVAAQAQRDQRKEAFRNLAEIAHDAFLAYLVAGFMADQALELTMLQLSEGFSDAAG